jgi:hypothetical protein
MFEVLYYIFEGLDNYEANDPVMLETSKVLLPLQILHQTLVLAISKWRRCSMVGRNVYLDSLLLKQGWCKHFVQNLSSNELAVYEQCYILSLGGPRNQINHTLCSPSICKMIQVESTESFKMKHVTEGCQCVRVAPS